MPFIVGGAIAGAGSLLGGLFGANAASSAANAQVKAQQNAINAQVGIAGIEQGQLAPFLGAGTNAISELQGGLQPGGQFANDGTLRQLQALGYNIPQLQTANLQTENLQPANLNIPDPSNPATIGQFQQ